VFPDVILALGLAPPIGLPWRRATVEFAGSGTPFSTSAAAGELAERDLFLLAPRESAEDT